MKLISKNAIMLALVTTANKADTSVRTDYHTAFVSAVVGITGIDSTTDSGKETGLESTDGHGNITVLTHLIVKIDTKSAYRKKIISWLEFYCNIHFNTNEHKFEYKIEDGAKQFISPDVYETLISNPFWEKLPNSVTEFDYMKEMERLQKKVDQLIEKAVNAGLEVGEEHNLVTIQHILNGTVVVEGEVVTV